MKIKNLLLAILAISLFVSCEKDNDNDSSPSKNSHRIKQIFSEYDNYSKKTVFSYEGEKLVNITEYLKFESGINEEFKAEITYSGDNATETWYHKESGSWELDEKYEYVIQNGLMMEETDYDYGNGTWIEDGKWTYQYSGNNISGWQGYEDEDEDGTLEQDSKGEYIYQNGKLSEYKGYELDESNNWYQDYKTTFTYAGSNMINWIDFNLDESDNWKNYYKAEYQYSGDKVSQIEGFYWNSNDSQWESVDLDSYTYNSNGYLIGELDDDGEKRTYEYEEGNGNAKFFWYYPEELVYGEPTLKSASINKSRKYIPYYQRLRNR